MLAAYTLGCLDCALVCTPRLFRFESCTRAAFLSQTAIPRSPYMQRSMEEVAAEWIRAVRGRRPQVIVSRRLGYKSNVVYR